MTVYVDKLFVAIPKGKAKTYGKLWCHMFSDGNEGELHEIAQRIKLKKEYFQKHRIANHYDLTPAKRQLAIALGAVEVSTILDVFPIGGGLSV